MGICKVLPVRSRQEDVESPGEHPHSWGRRWGTAACQVLTPEHSQQREQQLLSPTERSVLTVPTHQTCFLASILREKEPKCFQALIREGFARHAKEAKKKKYHVLLLSGNVETLSKPGRKGLWEYLN